MEISLENLYVDTGGLKGYPHVHILHTDLHTFPELVACFPW